MIKDTGDPEIKDLAAKMNPVAVFILVATTPLVIGRRILKMLHRAVIDVVS